MKPRRIGLVEGTVETLERLLLFMPPKCHGVGGKRIILVMGGDAESLRLYRGSGTDMARSGWL